VPWETREVDALELVKYEAIGNDFLVLFDLDADAPFDAELVAALCDRRHGIGADGVLRLGRSSTATIAMSLKNADGSDAETSGNGLRCAALAAVHAGLAPDELVIGTVAGPVRAAVELRGEGRADVTVEMGAAIVRRLGSPLAGYEAFEVHAGNPHLVLVAGPSRAALAAIDLEALGRPLEGAVAGGQNVEFIAAGDDTARITLRVWERGAGITEACGSGSVAAAAACHFAGLVGERVTVENPGGDLVVTLAGDDRARPRATLAGPARRVATVRVAPHELAAPVRR
jgi:diaminopimelate epimerase